MFQLQRRKCKLFSLQRAYQLHSNCRSVHFIESLVHHSRDLLLTLLDRSSNLASLVPAQAMQEGRVESSIEVEQQNERGSIDLAGFRDTSRWDVQIVWGKSAAGYQYWAAVRAVPGEVWDRVAGKYGADQKGNRLQHNAYRLSSHQTMTNDVSLNDYHYHLQLFGKLLIRYEIAGL